ncbi:MAG TPA: AAA family ATPase [Planctomycetota bacterium]|nr:AAA family ATPase [Planctomycetota bacterium]
MSEATLAELEREIGEIRQRCAALRAEIGRVYLGNPELIEWLTTAALCGGHVLLEGVPGLGKTVLVKAFAGALDVRFSRIQFTPDLMPADITGTNILVEEGGTRVFRFQPGPIFANLVLADEINRATPKTQSALLEAMQESGVTVAGKRYPLDAPFLVVATQNPIEMEGTYPLPEAQLDRFFFKLKLPAPSEQQLVAVLDATTGPRDTEARPAMRGSELVRARSLAREVPVSEAMKHFVARTLRATDPAAPEATPLARRYVRCGASPRGGQAMLLAAKAIALLSGRFHVERGDLERAALPALRHRVLRSFEGDAEGIDPDRIVEEALTSARKER